MTAFPAEPSWGRRRWYFTVLVVFAVQLGLIFWLSDRRPVSARPPAFAPALRLAGPDAAELLALLNPTLFALPNRHGFSGATWLTAPRLEFRPFDWTEPPRWLPVPAAELGAVFHRFSLTNLSQPALRPSRPEPEMTLPTTRAASMLPVRSELHVEGELAGRALLTTLAVPPWPHPDLLTNSVVQVVVDPAGRPRSIALLASSGSKAADQHALDQARTARFEPLPGGRPAAGFGGWQWGRLIFEWCTVAPPASNAPVLAP